MRRSALPASLTQWSAVETTTPGRAGAHTAPLPARPDTRSHPIHRAPLELDHLRGVPGPSQTVHRRRPRLGQERRGDVPRRDRSDLAGPRVAIAAHPPDRKAQGHSVPRSHRRNISAASGPACRWSTRRAASSSSSESGQARSSSSPSAERRSLASCRSMLHGAGVSLRGIWSHRMVIRRDIVQVDWADEWESASESAPRHARAGVVASRAARPLGSAGRGTRERRASANHSRWRPSPCGIWPGCSRGAVSSSAARPTRSWRSWRAILASPSSRSALGSRSRARGLVPRFTVIRLTS